MASAARTARSASSSCACGMPNAAMTASPANFSTMPPCVITQCETRSKNAFTRRRTTSGSLADDERGRPDQVDEEHRRELALDASLKCRCDPGRAAAGRGTGPDSIAPVLDPKVFKAYDVRGVYPAELDEDGAYAIGRAYVEEFEPRTRSRSAATCGSRRRRWHGRR